MSSKKIQKKLIYLVTPMWPSAAWPYLGIFVKKTAEGLVENGWNVDDRASGRTNRRGILGKIERHIRVPLFTLLLLFKPKGIIYCHSPSWFSIFLHMVVAARGMPLIINIHGSEIHGRSRLARAFWWSTRALIKNADLVVSPSVAFSSLIVKATQLDPEKIFVSPSGGVDDKNFRPVPRNAALAETLDLSTESRVIGYVSRIVSGKGWRMFLDVSEAMHRADPNLMALVIGGGQEQGLLESEILARNMAAYVKFLGPTPNDKLPDLFSLMDVFLFTTAMTGVDTLGLVALEALSCGVPVVALDHPISREYILPGLNGLFAASLDAVEFSKAATECMYGDFGNSVDATAICKSVERYGSIEVNKSLSREFWSKFISIPTR